MITQLLTDKLKDAFKRLGYDTKHALVSLSNRPDLSQYQCNAALAMAKELKKPPREIAESILKELEKEKTLFSDIFVEGPGFINIVLADKSLIRFANTYMKDPSLGVALPLEKKKIIVDFLGANVAKPMHVGHLRSAIIGDALQRLYRFLGHDVLTDTHLGDWGTQMGMLIYALREEQPGLCYFDEGFRSDYPLEPPVTLHDLEALYLRASTKCKQDASAMAQALRATRDLQAGRRGYRALWQHFVNLSMADLKRELRHLDIEFDLWRGESHYHAMALHLAEEWKKSGLAKESKGALIIALDDVAGERELPPVLLLKSDGAVLYHSSDMAAFYERVKKQNADLILYVVDLRQSLHFKQVFAACKKVGLLDETEAIHIGFGTVNGKDGKPFKTREGGAMKLKHLIEMVKAKALERMEEIEVAKNHPQEEKKQIAEMVGVATLKFLDLVNNRRSDYVFDLERFSKFEGKTGPSILYSAVRIKSLLRKAGDQPNHEIQAFSHPAERHLAVFLLQFPESIHLMQSQNMPHYLCEYVFHLSQAFNRFYAERRILTETDPVQRSSLLALCRYCLKTFETSLSILGMKIPERM